MEVIPLEEHLSNLGTSCCIGTSGNHQALILDSVHETKRAVVLSLDQIDEHLTNTQTNADGECCADEEFDESQKYHLAHDGSEDGAENVSPTLVTQLVSDEHILQSKQGNKGFDELFSRASSESNSTHPSELSHEDALALEVGHSAHEYLEECFYTEVKVLNREKFDAIPEVCKSDFTIKGHLGKGSYSDVFEVVFKKKKEAGKYSIKMNKNGELIKTRCHAQRPARIARRATTALSCSINLGTLARPSASSSKERSHTYAMKCLRPQIRSDPEQFMIGAEDLVHETAILANLDHPNIIKVHGRACGHLTNAFVLNDSYFILLDKLETTLHDRMNGWKSDPETLQGPTMTQIEVAYAVSDAMSYLHSKSILFRDLKPANVGFDAMGNMKMFDFGFAIGLPEKDMHMNPSGLLYDRCGTPRYMAPEVGLSMGYSLPSDVYSFGILLWQICALETPFMDITSASEFDQSVFHEGMRPEMDDCWPGYVKQLMSSCWCSAPNKRPTMANVKSALSLAISAQISTGTSNGEVMSPRNNVAINRRPRMNIGMRRVSVDGW